MNWLVGDSAFDTKDLRRAPKPECRTPEIAAGFLRMGPWEHTGMTVAAITRQQYLDDVTQHIGVTFLGQGLRCASCHDHKFDPVPTKDYYRIQAVFAPVQFVERPVPFLETRTRRASPVGRPQVEARLKQLEALQAIRSSRRTRTPPPRSSKRTASQKPWMICRRRSVRRKDYLGGTFGLSQSISRCARSTKSSASTWSAN